MIKKNLKILILTSAITLLPIPAGLLLWSRLPDEIATHFNAQGIADGFSSKSFSVFALPLFMLAVHWFCTFITSVDPKKQNIGGKPLKLVFWICPATSILVSGIIYASALKVKLNISVIMSVFFGILFIIIGNYLPKCRQNHSIGIKISWTLNSEDNWNYTHRLAGKLWVIGGIIILLTSFLKQYWIFFAVTVIMIIIPVICSYVYHKKHTA